MTAINQESRYAIEEAVYTIPFLPSFLPDWFVWAIEKLIAKPGHLFLCLVKQNINEEPMPIAAMHGLATHIHQKTNGELDKTVLPIGKGRDDFLVLYHIFNHWGYQVKIHAIESDENLEETEKQELINQIKEEKAQDEQVIGLKTTENLANFKAVDKITNGHPERYWLTRHARMVICDFSEEAEVVLQKWHCFNNFKEDYNKDPKHYPKYGLGASYFCGKKPSNSNAAYTTFEYIIGQVANGFSGFLIPGLGGLLWSAEKLDQWCQGHVTPDINSTVLNAATIKNATGNDVNLIDKISVFREQGILTQTNSIHLHAL